ncbi:hypothetical protein [Flavisolibacter ginsenosidimutans]|uniref:Uncharacterized protein n=1 Tax=Flavisolibacter ginsenosidimutans TaxID=661481 RepID=A0A5B8UIL8_9BACT|nr:hypothetical protein [Flavisolibacter ginsenosidimutans]QEC56226.1 hypothetical protein FSB75_10100 [Flavisolibacter ginsenosidimutans]
MKPILLSGTLALALSSCTQFQYLTVSGTNLVKNERNELTAENDTLKIQYHFADYKGQMGIGVYNKTTELLEIDWKKSAIIVDGKAFSYFNTNAIISGVIERDSLQWRKYLRGLGDPVFLASLNGSVWIDQPTQFIPPLAYIYKAPLALPIEQLQNLPEQTAKKERTLLAEDVYTSYNKMEFKKDSSPLTFRSYLTFRIGGAGSQKEFTVEHNFYVSEVWKTTSGPDNFPETMINRGDRFYLQP